MAKLHKKYKFAVIATDVVLFTVHEKELMVLLIKMKKHPFENAWAAPGGLVGPEESVGEAAAKHLANKAGIKNVYLEQFYTFGEVNRDPFGRVVSVAHLALIPKSRYVLKTSEEYEDVRWFSVKDLPSLAYDHKDMIKLGIEKLKDRLKTSNIVYSLLPQEFTLSELQKIYEIILGRKFDKRNFRKKFLSLNIIKSLQKQRRGGANRPAQLYTFIARSPRLVEVI